MPTGTVKWFNEKKGYGFIRPDGPGPQQPDVFVHIRQLEKSNLEYLDEGDYVSFDLIEGKAGKQQAGNIKLVSSHAGP